MSIRQLNQGTPTSASQLPFYDPTNGADRRCSLGDVAAVMEDLLTPNAGLITQYAAPNATGFSISVNPPTTGTSIYLLMTPVAGYAAGTVTLPVQANCIDGQELLVSCTQSVAALTVDGNGSTVNGAPMSLSSNGFFRLRFDGVFDAWYRVG